MTKETSHEEVEFIERQKKRGQMLRRWFQKITSPLTDALDGIDIDFEDRSAGKKTLIALFKLRRAVCILLAVIVLASGTVFIMQSESKSTAEMSLNFEESAKGLNPNSTRFNVHDMVSPEVVEGMLVYCGIEPESVDVNEVIDCISIRPTNRKEFSEDNFFISTSYKVTMKMPSCIKGVSIHDLLTFLCKAYKDNLYSKYTENRSILSFDIDQFHEKEYMEIADLLDLKAQQIEKYLNMRVKQSKTFTEQESDETFKSLVQKVEDLRTYDIAKYRVYVLEEGCSHDKPNYIRSLSYINSINTLSYSKDMAGYDVNSDGIRIYDKDLISIVMIPSIDMAKNTYYMSKTKTGMDYMAKRANDYLTSAQETYKAIRINQNTITKMRAGKNDKATTQKADEMIEAIRLKFSELSKQIETVDKAYIKYKTKDYLTFKAANPSMLQKLQVSKLATIAVVAMAGIFILLWIRFKYYGGGKKR